MESSGVCNDEFDPTLSTSFDADVGVLILAANSSRKVIERMIVTW